MNDFKYIRLSKPEAALSGITQEYFCEPHSIGEVQSCRH